MAVPVIEAFGLSGPRHSNHQLLLTQETKEGPSPVYIQSALETHGVLFGDALTCTQ